MFDIFILLFDATEHIGMWIFARVVELLVELAV